MIGTFPGEESCLSLVWAVLDSKSTTLATGSSSPKSTAKSSTDSGTSRQNQRPRKRRSLHKLPATGNRTKVNLQQAQGRDLGSHDALASTRKGEPADRFEPCWQEPTRLNANHFARFLAGRCRSTKRDSEGRARSLTSRDQDPHGCPVARPLLALTEAGAWTVIHETLVPHHTGSLLFSLRRHFFEVYIVITYFHTVRACRLGEHLTIGAATAGFRSGFTAFFCPAVQAAFS